MEDLNADLDGDIRVTANTLGTDHRAIYACICNATALFKDDDDERNDYLYGPGGQLGNHHGQEVVKAVLWEMGIAVTGINEVGSGMYRMSENIFNAQVLNPSAFARPVKIFLSKVTNSAIVRMFEGTLVWVTVELEIKLQGRAVSCQTVDPVDLLHMKTSRSASYEILGRVPFADVPEGDLHESRVPTRRTRFEMCTATLCRVIVNVIYERQPLPEQLSEHLKRSELIAD